MKNPLNMNRAKLEDKTMIVKMAFIGIFILSCALFLAFSRYKNIRYDIDRFENDKSDVSETVTNIENEILKLDESSSLEELSEITTNTQDLCRDLFYDIPRYDFEYDTNIKYTSLDLINSCNLIENKLLKMKYDYLYFELLDRGVNEDDIYYLNSYLQELKDYNNELSKITIILYEVIIDDRFYFYFVTLIGVYMFIMVRFVYRKIKDR